VYLSMPHYRDRYEPAFTRRFYRLNLGGKLKEKMSDSAVLSLSLGLFHFWTTRLFHNISKGYEVSAIIRIITTRSEGNSPFNKYLPTVNELEL